MKHEGKREVDSISYEEKLKELKKIKQLKSPGLGSVTFEFLENERRVHGQIID